MTTFEQEVIKKSDLDTTGSLWRQVFEVFEVFEGI